MRLSKVGRVALGAVVLAGGLSAGAILQPEAAVQEGGPPAPAPTPQHKMLAHGAGTWDVELKLFMGGPDAPPEVSKGVETATVLPGGLWTLSEFKAELAGQPFEGRGQTGYDPKKGKFVATWIDSMSTHLIVMEGAYDEGSKTLTMHADGVDPASGKPTKEKYITEYRDDDTHVFRIYAKQADPKGDFAKMMEATYKRRKAS